MVIRPRRRFFSAYNAPLLGVGAILVALIPIALEPIMNTKKYSKAATISINIGDG